MIMSKKEMLSENSNTLLLGATLDEDGWLDIERIGLSSRRT